MVLLSFPHLPGHACFLGPGHPVPACPLCHLPWPLAGSVWYHVTKQAFELPPQSGAITLVHQVSMQATLTGQPDPVACGGTTGEETQVSGWGSEGAHLKAG